MGAATVPYLEDAKVATDVKTLRVHVPPALGSKATLQLTGCAPVRVSVGASKNRAKGVQRKASITSRGYGGGILGIRSKPPMPPEKGRSHGKSFSSFPQAS